MKKLMIAAMAVAAGAAFADPITSANIVGYAAESDGEHSSLGVGSIFMPIGLGENYKLSSITVGTDDPSVFMTPGDEYLQKLDPDEVYVTDRYTYVSADFLKDEFGAANFDEYKWAIGWWNWSFDIADKIDAGEDEDMCDPDLEFPVGTAFLGFLSGSGLNFTSNGEVPQVTTSFNDGGHSSPFFLNYLPVSIDLTSVTVDCDEEDVFMTPGDEYLQVLDPDEVYVTDRYTYVSAEFIKDEFGAANFDEYKWAVGWWRWSFDIADKIDAGESEDMIQKGDVTLTPGFSFLGFLSGNGLDFNFPSATKSDK